MQALTAPALAPRSGLFTRIVRVMPIVVANVSKILAVSMCFYLLNQLADNGDAYPRGLRRLYGRNRHSQAVYPFVVRVAVYVPEGKGA
jgi:hypothetical protein